MPILFLRVIFQGAMMVLIQPGIYLIPYFVLLNNFGKKKKKKKGSILAERMRLEGRLSGKDCEVRKEVDCPGCSLY